MARKRRRPMGSWSGSVEVLVDGQSAGTGTARLEAVREEVEAAALDGSSEWLEGLEEWSGTLAGLDLGALWGQTLTLRFAKGDCEAFLRDMGGRLAFGSRPPVELR